MRRALLAGLLTLYATQAPAQDSAAAEGFVLAQPPRAEPGQCWAVIYFAPVLQKRTERVLQAPQSERVEMVPARYEWVTETVTVPAGKQRVVVQPAEYEITEEQVLVTPAGRREVRVAPRYRTVEERLPTRTGAVLKPDPVSGELCVVEGVVEYQLVKKKLLLEPAGTQTVEQPARYRTVRKKTLVREARTRTVDAPARQVRKRVKKLVEPAREQRVAVPAVYRELTRLVQVAPARSEWRSVLCQTNASPGLVKRIQQALKDAGHDPGAVDGRWGRRSAAALDGFQGEAGLGQGGMTIETLERLKIDFAGS